MDQVRFLGRIGKSRNLSKIVSVLLSASVERVGVFRMRDFYTRFEEKISTKLTRGLALDLRLAISWNQFPHSWERSCSVAWKRECLYSKVLVPRPGSQKKLSQKTVIFF